MEVVEITRTLLIGQYQFHRKNELGFCNIYVDEDIMSIFKPIDGKPINRLLEIDLLSVDVKDLHFSSDYIHYNYRTGKGTTEVKIPYKGIVGYELNNTVQALPHITTSDQTYIDSVTEHLLAKVEEERGKVKRSSSKETNVVVFPKAFKKRDPSISTQS